MKTPPEITYYPILAYVATRRDQWGEGKTPDEAVADLEKKWDYDYGKFDTNDIIVNAVTKRATVRAISKYEFQWDSP